LRGATNRRNLLLDALLGAQQLVMLEKDLNGRVTTKEIMPVLFSVLEGSDQPNSMGRLQRQNACTNRRQFGLFALNREIQPNDYQPPALSIEHSGAVS
jgi:hypothetical protein